MSFALGVKQVGSEPQRPVVNRRCGLPRAIKRSRGNQAGPLASDARAPAVRSERGVVRGLLHNNESPSHARDDHSARVFSPR
jgi:hypothetical protein